MFDVGFSELVVIAIVALVVIGPERLPGVARTAGHLLGRLQRYVNDVKADINREIQLDELKKLKAEMQDSAQDFERSIRGQVESVEQAFGDAAQGAQTAIDDLSRTAESIPPSVDPLPAGAEHAPAELPTGVAAAPENRTGAGAT